MTGFKMPPSTTKTDYESVPSQLAQIHQQIKGLAASIDEVKNSVREVATLDKTLAELAIRHEQSHNRIEKHSVQLETQEKSFDILNDKLQERIQKVNTKADEWINKARGAWWIAMLLGGFAQAAILGMIAWTFGHVRTAEDEVLLMKYRVEQLEKTAARVESVVLRAEAAATANPR